MPSCRGSSRPRNRTRISYVSCIGRQFLYHLESSNSTMLKFNALSARILNVTLAQSCPTLSDCIVHGILQARILEWVAFPFSRGSSQPRIEPRSPTWRADSLPAEPQEKPKNTGVGSLSLLQRIFLAQESNGASCTAGGFFTSHQGSPDNRLQGFGKWTGGFCTARVLNAAKLSIRSEGSFSSCGAFPVARGEHPLPMPAVMPPNGPLQSEPVFFGHKKTAVATLYYKQGNSRGKVIGPGDE